MSVAMRAVSTSIDSPNLSSNLKESHKISNLESCEEKHVHDDDDSISKDLTSQKPGDDHDADDEHDTQGFEQLEKDNKGDESLSDDKEMKEVNVMSMSIVSPGRPDVVLGIPFHATTSKATLFTLKEGSKYRTIFHFTVSNNTVSGLCYSYMVWKAGIRVCHTKKTMGTFSPRQEPYTLELEEGTTPSGFFARGPFLVRSKFVDDDGKCYLDTTYYFDIRKDWGAKDKC